MTTEFKLLDIPAKKNACYLAGAKHTVRGIMWHSTAANNPNLRRYVQPCPDNPDRAGLLARLGANQYGNDWCCNAKPGGKSVCVHAFIGKLADGTVATAQILPWGVRGWHCGGSANTGYVSFEMCEDGGNDPAYMDAVYRQAVELSARLCLWYSLDPRKDGVILSHHEGAARGVASRHTDPDNWWKGRHTMDQARRDTAQMLAMLRATEGKQEDETMTDERYQTVDEIEREAPWAAPTVQKLLDRDILRGDGAGLDLSRDMLRLLVFNDRAGLYK